MVSRCVVILRPPKKWIVWFLKMNTILSKREQIRALDEGLENIIKAIETAKARLQANVNFDLTMELLFLTIREN